MLSLTLEGYAEIILGLGVAGFQFQRPLVLPDRLAEPALVLKGKSQIVVGFGKIRLQFQRPPVTGDRFGGPAQLRQRVAQVALRLGMAGFSSSARWKQPIASSAWPWFSRRSPRLLWASTKSPFSSRARW